MGGRGKPFCPFHEHLCAPLSPNAVLQVESGVSENQLVLKTPIDDSYEEEEAGEMVIIINKVCVFMCMHPCMLVCVCVVCFFCHVRACHMCICMHVCILPITMMYIYPHLYVRMHNPLILTKITCNRNI